MSGSGPYSIQFGNNDKSLRCNCEVTVDGKWIGTYQLLPESKYSISSDINGNPFKFDGTNIKIEATFYPEKYPHSSTHCGSQYGRNTILPGDIRHVTSNSKYANCIAVNKEKVITLHALLTSLSNEEL